MNNNNNLKDSLFSELYKRGFGFNFCETVANTICEINPPSGNQNEEWVQIIMYDRLKHIEQAIHETLVPIAYQKLS